MLNALLPADELTGQAGLGCRKEIWDNALTTRRVGKEGRKDDSGEERVGGRMKEINLQDIKGGKEPQCLMLLSFTNS